MPATGGGTTFVKKAGETMESDVKELLKRAGADASPAPRVRKDNRYVFNGEKPANPGTPAYRPNKRTVRRKVSTFTVLAALFGSGIVIVAYISNVIAVDTLAAETGRRQAQLEAQLSVNATLRAELNKKAAWERIGRTATDQLGLVFPTEQSVQLELDSHARARLEKR
jgi:hypothetical protein